MYQVCIDSYGSVLDLQVGAMLFAWYVVCLVSLFLSDEGLLAENCFAFYVLFLFYVVQIFCHQLGIHYMNYDLSVVIPIISCAIPASC